MQYSFTFAKKSWRFITKKSRKSCTTPLVRKSLLLWSEDLLRGEH